jgi:SAM-dependent methyltransferase
MIDRKLYMKQVYAKYWLTAREEVYGFTGYDKSLCAYLTAHAPRAEKLLEIAVGTGYPIADYLQQRGYAICGIDLSFDLIRKCRQTNGAISAAVADSENLPFADETFGCTYCFHSTWYFPDLGRALAEMLRVCRTAGLVMFDIQNRRCVSVERAYRARLAQLKAGTMIVRWIKNCAKIALRRGTPQWHAIVHEVPTYPERVVEILSANAVSNYHVFAQRSQSLVEIDLAAGASDGDDRLVFVAQK